MNVNMQGGMANAMSGFVGGKKISAGAVWGLVIGAVVVNAAIDFVCWYVVNINLSPWIWRAIAALTFGAAGFMGGAKSNISKGGGISACIVGALVYAGITLVVAAMAAMKAGELSHAMGAGNTGFVVVMIAGVVDAAINLAFALAPSLGGFLRGRAMAETAHPGVPAGAR